MKRAQTTDEALRPEAARPTTTARAAKRAAAETRPGLGREAHEAQGTNATCALHAGAPTSARRLRPRRRLREQAAKITDQREGEACVSENVTYVRGASKTMAAQRPHLSATSLKLDPGTGLAPPREVSRAAWGGGRMITPTRSARPVTDQGQLCISSVLGHARLDPINTPRDRDINHQPPPWP